MDFTVSFGSFGSGKIPEGGLEKIQALGQVLNPVDLKESASDPVAKWVAELIQRAKNNLEAEGIMNSELIKSITPSTFKVSANSIEVEITGNYYWKFVDLGVKGSKSSAKAPESPFSYKKKRPPYQALERYITNKSIAVEPKYVKKLGRNRTIAEQVTADAKALSAVIFYRGLKATKFMSEAMDESFVEELTVTIAEAIGRQITFSQAEFK